MRPPVNVRTVRYAVVPITLWPTICTPQPETEILVFCLNTLPFCAVIVVGITSGFVHRLPLAVRAECGPAGSVSVKLDTGASGVDVNVVFVIPFLMSVLPTRMMRTPLPSSTMSRSGNASPPWETKYAGPLIGVGSTGVIAVAVPTCDSGEQLNGFASNVFARHAFWSVVKREGSAFGSTVTLERMFASPAGWVTVTLRLVPFTFVTFALVDADNAGLKASFSQPSAWNGLFSSAL